MSSTITASVVTGGTNSHATSSAEVNALATDVMSQGVVGSFTANTGSGGTGSFCVNAQGTPAMFVDVKAGQAWITATPSGQASQKLRASMTADYTSYAISSNSSGSTKYDWIYLKIDPTAANNPASDASDVASLYTSRSSSNSADNGTPPTYGKLLAIVTVANGASSITNSNITDKRVRALPHGGINDSNDNEEIKVVATASAVNEITVTNAATGNAPSIAASGDDTNIDLKLSPKGTGAVQLFGAVLKGLVYRRQGGSSTVYSTAGTTTYDSSADKVVVQAGCVTTSNAGDTTVTFPVAFAQAPLVIATPNTANNASTFAVVASSTSSSFVLRAYTSSARVIENVAWLAIGPAS